MKLKFLFFALAVSVFAVSHAQITPERYNAEHSDSCWHFTFDYNTPEIPSDNGMVVITHLCTPDTCISSTARHYQGKRYNRRYIRRYGNSPELSQTGWNECTLTIPESAINDTIYGVTYCEYSDKDGCHQSYDTVAICMPQAPSMSCHRVKPMRTIADHIAMEHPHVRSMAHYVPLNSQSASEADITPSVVRYVTNSSKLNPEYLQNAESIEELMGIINDVLADSTTTIEAIQIAGYTSPDGSESANSRLGYARAKALRDHIKQHHHLPDSIFEIADGGKHWEMVYDDIRSMRTYDGDELISRLKAEKSPQKREAMLKSYNGGTLYRELLERMFPAHRIACCTGIYYNNKEDSITYALNRIVDELIYNPAPDYRKLIDELKQYDDDPRVLNLQGVIEYSRHHRHAAERAFTKAAEMGDEQALVNLRIIENEKNK
ncbi:MAG: hypothetical protein J6Q48_00380 [Bacteroidaceae bacterium]|nr:hypothetical protein [Bacteroidaceae bacterium]